MIPSFTTVSPGSSTALPAVTATGRVDNVAAGVHTFKIGYTQSAGDPATITLEQGDGYSLITPQP
jgi:hypothetical protein